MKHSFLFIALIIVGFLTIDYFGGLSAIVDNTYDFCVSLPETGQSIGYEVRGFFSFFYDASVFFVDFSITLYENFV